MDRPTEFADIPDEIRAMGRAQLEWAAAPALNRLMDPERDRVTRARAELVWRDREYAEAQETSQRKFETDHQAARQGLRGKARAASDGSRGEAGEGAAQHGTGCGKSGEMGSVGGGSGGPRGDRADYRRVCEVKPYRGPPATLGSTAAASARIIVWCRDCRHQVEPDAAEQAAAREAAKAAAIARAQAQGRASSLAPLEPVAPEPFVEVPVEAEPEEPEPLEEIAPIARPVTQLPPLRMSSNSAI
jgi:hypothetical protein